MAAKMTSGRAIVYRESPLVAPHLALVSRIWAATRLGDMAQRRIVGSHFNKQGKPKRGYAKEEVAKAEAARFRMTYYRCDVCDRFHLTSK
jgi:hypothetical protein